MAVVIAPTQADIQKALVAFLAAVVPGVEAFEGQENRIPEPVAADWIVFWPMRRPYLSTDVEAVQFGSFTGSIAGNTLTVAAVTVGAVPIGGHVYGNGIDPATVISSQINGAAGGPGAYALEGPAQSVSLSALVASTLTEMESAEWVFQVGVHGPSSSENAAIIAIATRSDFAVRTFAAINPDVGVLYADEPRYAPFQNAEQQYEPRWIVELHLQANQTVSGLPQDTMGIAAVTPVSVDVAFPP